MSGPLKTLLLWILISALPLQSLAAVLHVECATIGVQLTVPIPDRDRPAMGGQDHSPGLATAPDHAAAEAAPSTSVPPSHTCAASHLSATLPAPGARPSLDRSFSFAAPLADEAFSGHVPDPLKRPPKLFLA
jgi:hypothetical protein